MMCVETVKAELIPNGLYLSDVAYGVCREQMLKTMQWP